MPFAIDFSRFSNEELLKHATAVADLARKLDDDDSYAALDAALAELCRREELLG